VIGWWFLVGRGKVEGGREKLALLFFVTTKNIEAPPKLDALPLALFKTSAERINMKSFTLR